MEGHETYDLSKPFYLLFRCLQLGTGTVGGREQLLAHVMTAEESV
jgi:hypothetical protein